MKLHTNRSADLKIAKEKLTQENTDRDCVVLVINTQS